MPPSKDEKEQTKVNIEINNGGEPETEGEDIVVDLGKDKSDAKPVQPEQIDYQEIKRLHNRSEYLNRNLEKTLKQVQTLVSQMQVKPSVSEDVEKPQPGDELDQIVEKDWKQAVSILGEKAARKVYEDLQKAERKRQEEESRILRLESSKQKVLKKYPTIEDESSEEARLYSQVLNENPELLTNVYGPELAMYKMEEKMRASGSTPPDLKEKIAEETEREIQRRTRIQSSQVPMGRKTQDSKIVLTASEKEYCDRNSIPIEEYAKMKTLGQQQFREGVSV